LAPVEPSRLFLFARLAIAGKRRRFARPVRAGVAPMPQMPEKRDLAHDSRNGKPRLADMPAKKKAQQSRAWLTAKSQC
jgi:hypothetical protein